MERFIKIYDKLIDSPVFRNEKLLKVWIWCLLKATYKPFDAIVGHQLIHLEAGQFIFGVNAASSALNIPPSTVYTYMKTLEKMGNIGMKSKNKYSVVTVENWAFYQVDETKTESKLKTNGKQTDTYKNIKNNNKKFIPPTLEEVKQYVNESNLKYVDANFFFKYYSTSEWKDQNGKPVANWKLKAVTWNKRGEDKAPPEVPKVKYEV